MAIDKERRKAVMGRSMRLGHCVCNPKKPCPCDTFKEYGVCQCAGEKMPAPKKRVPLTQYVKKAGCASKIGQADLHRVLSQLPPVQDENVLVGVAAGDDAGVYRLSDSEALVQTVDVFTPCVDDPYLFGQIAAANSISDVYAMGGKPVCALSVVGFPIEDLPGEMMTEMLRGGVDKLNEAGCPVVGGHSIIDEEVKFGFAITGLIDPDQVVERDRAEVGDVLVLTKPIGTGMIAFAAQIGRVSQACLVEAGNGMAALNKDAAELMNRHGSHACTDITGYGLAGHLVQMVHGSDVSAEIDLSKLPVYGAIPACLENEVMPGAIERNQAYAGAWVRVADGESDSNLPVLYDPQTSGGLLIALPESEADAFVNGLKDRGNAAASIIGKIVAKPAERERGEIIIINGEISNIIGTQYEVTETMTQQSSRPEDAAQEEPCCAAAEPVESSCCGPVAGEESCCNTAAAGGAAGDPLAIFKEFMAAANAPGLLNRRTKKMIAIALSIAHHCEPCLRKHLEGALAMKLTKAEIDEAANLATSFGGCTAMMFYREVSEPIFAK